jgi:DNA-binding NarL/FixJ family response regulator
MSLINYDEIKEIVRHGVAAGQISNPVPMRRDPIVKKKSAYGVPYSRKSWAWEICQTRREEILAWVNEGQSQAEIAKKLGMSTGPVSRFLLAEGVSTGTGKYKRQPGKKYGRTGPN